MTPRLLEQSRKCVVTSLIDGRQSAETGPDVLTTESLADVGSGWRNFGHGPGPW
jgi:hypothetical protein